MKLVDQEPQSWFLLEENGALFLDAACDHGAFGYSWLIELNAAERQAYAAQGRAFLFWLAQDIHNGVPILEASRSPYKARNRDAALGGRVSEAIRLWRQS